MFTTQTAPPTVPTRMSTSTAIADSPGWLKCTKDTAATLQSIATVAALLIGAWWVLRRRRTYPRANFKHLVSSVRLNEKVNLIRVAVEIDNVGDVLLNIEKSIAGIQQVVPIPDHLRATLENRAALVGTTESELDWPFIDARYRNWGGSSIEPGESAAFHFELLSPTSVQTILVYSYFRNITRPGDEGWNTSTLFEVKASEPKTQG